MLWEWIELRYRRSAIATTSSAISRESPAETPKVRLVPTESSASVKQTIGYDRRNLFYGRDRGDEVSAVIRKGETRSTLKRLLSSRSGEKDVWALVLWSIDQGFLTTETSGSVRSATLRLLFPQAPVGYAQTFDLSKPRDRVRVREVVHPAALEYRDRILEKPMLFEHCIREYEQRRQAEQVAAIQTAKLEEARQRMPAHEQDIVLYGRRFWPLIDPKIPYSYDQIRTAAWIFRDYEAWFEKGESRESKAITIRQSTRWFSLFLKSYPHPEIAKVFSLLHSIATQYTQNRNADDFICPPSPKTDED